MVALPDQTSFNASDQSEQSDDSIFTCRGGEDDGVMSSDEVEEERSLVSGKVDEEIVKLIYLESMNIDETCSYNEETSVVRNELDKIDGQIVTDSEEEGEEKTIDSEVLAAFLKAVTRTNRSNIFPNQQVSMVDESDEINLSKEEKHKLEKLQSIRVKYLRLVHSLGQSVDDSIAAQFLHRIALIAGRNSRHSSFSLDAAKKMVSESEDLKFSLNILVLGKFGVGKSATINSIFGDQKVLVNAFGPSTNSVRKISGTVNGIEMTIIDPPGLMSYAMDQSTNTKILSSVKKVIKNCPPDVVLYVDRLDAQNRSLNNIPLVRTITTCLGSSIWDNAIVTLTHAGSAPPDGPSGTRLSYDVFVAQCSHIVQQSIGQAVGDLRFINPSLMNPVSLVENHPLCRKNREGVKVLPNGQTWRPQLLLLCYSLKVLSEANSLKKPQEPLDQRKYLWSRLKSLPLPNLLSWLSQSRAHPKLHEGEDIDSDIDIDDGEDEDEYDQLPPFKPLRRAQLAKLSKEHKEAYFDEYHYRVKLLQKKQWREEIRMKRNNESEEEEAPPASPHGLSPAIVLPPSFDSDDSAYLYRSLESTSQFITKSTLDSHWDHDIGSNRVMAEYKHTIAKCFPAGVSVEMIKDKKDFDILVNSSVCAKHGVNRSTMGEFLVRGNEQRIYLLKGETKFNNSKKNEMTLGGLMTYMDGVIANGFNMEKQIPLRGRVVLVGNVGTIRSQGDKAYEANLEVKLREDDFLIDQNQYVLGLTAKKSKDDFIVSGNVRSQLSIGRQTKLAVSASLDSKKTGHINIRTTSGDSLQIASMAIIPSVMYIYKRFFPSRET